MRRPRGALSGCRYNGIEMGAPIKALNYQRGRG